MLKAFAVALVALALGAGAAGAQQAIDALSAGDASVLERLMRALQKPYDAQPEYDDLAARRPEWARNRPGCSALSCSS